MSIKVSVILAIYNVEKYIRQTLDSVVNQTMKDIEIIIVDNKSTDKTLEIVEEYAKNDERFVIYKNSSNLKQGIARNFGVQMARGEYIFFIDGDDYMELDAVEKLYNRITETDADITLCTWNQFDDRTGKIDKGHVYAKLKQIPEEFDNKTFNWRDIKYSVFWQTSVPWDKMYKRSFLINKDVKFPGGIYFEDNVFVYDALFKAEKMSVLREDLIYYRCNRKNAVTNSRNYLFFDYFKIFNLIGDNLKKIDLFDEMKYYYWDYKVITLYWWFMKVRLPYKRKFFNMMKNDFKHLGICEEDKEFVRNRTLFLIDRFTKLPFFVYYPLFFFFDKIFRIEKGVKNYAVIWFSTFEKWYDYKK
ncbi:glycosyltransferase family 2 protein [bacterium]|nr:glycosyltransferase family 2 protein [bacterium]